MDLLSVHCNEFVNDVGELILHMIIDGMHENMGIGVEDNNDAHKWNAEIEDPNAEKEKKNEKLKKLKEKFIEKVKKMYNLTKLQDRPDADRYMEKIKRVAIEIYNSSKGDNAEQQLTFLLELFVVKLKHFEMLISDLDISKNWKMRMTEESQLSGKN
jgi:CRISPR/Cas system endoribonuclease Cas6 (RAMP superfamily)